MLEELPIADGILLRADPQGDRWQYRDPNQDPPGTGSEEVSRSGGGIGFWRRVALGAAPNLRIRGPS